MEDEDRLEGFALCIDALQAGIEVHRVASTEACHLRRIPSQNAGRGVVRNYVRTGLSSLVLAFDLTRVGALCCHQLVMAHRIAMSPPTRGLRHPLLFSASRNSMQTRLGDG